MTDAVLFDMLVRRTHARNGKRVIRNEYFLSELTLTLPSMSARRLRRRCSEAGTNGMKPQLFVESIALKTQSTKPDQFFEQGGLHHVGSLLLSDSGSL